MSKGKEFQEMTVQQEVKAALHKARVKHREPYHSYHEGISIIREEFEELWDSIRLNCIDAEIRIEALHLAATAQRFIEDLL